MYLINDVWKHKATSQFRTVKMIDKVWLPRQHMRLPQSAKNYI